MNRIGARVIRPADMRFLVERATPEGTVIDLIQDGQDVGETTRLADQDAIERLLFNPEELSLEWRRYIIVADRNVCAGPYASLFAPCLYFQNESWHMGVVWIGTFGAPNRFLAWT